MIARTVTLTLSPLSFASLEVMLRNARCAALNWLAARGLIAYEREPTASSGEGRMTGKHRVSGGHSWSAMQDWGGQEPPKHLSSSRTAHSSSSFSDMNLLHAQFTRESTSPRHVTFPE